jgi:hypothetical protein
VLVEALAYAGDQLAAYADRVAAEGCLPSRRRALVVGAVLSVLGFVWWRTRNGDD